MAYVKGQARPKGAGRKKGTPNSSPGLRRLVLGALDEAGGQRYLLSVAKKDPKAFLALLGRFVPAEAKVHLDAGDGALQFTVLSGIVAGAPGTQIDKGMAATAIEATATRRTIDPGLEPRPVPAGSDDAVGG